MWFSSFRLTSAVVCDNRPPLCVHDVCPVSPCPFGRVSLQHICACLCGSSSSEAVCVEKNSLAAHLYVVAWFPCSIAVCLDGVSLQQTWVCSGARHLQLIAPMPAASSLLHVRPCAVLHLTVLQHRIFCWPLCCSAGHPRPNSRSSHPADSPHPWATHHSHPFAQNTPPPAPPLNQCNPMSHSVFPPLFFHSNPLIVACRLLCCSVELTPAQPACASCTPSLRLDLTVLHCTLFPLHLQAAMLFS